MKISRMIVERGGSLFVRHRVIAEVVFDFVRKEGMLKAVVIGLAVVCASQVKRDMAGWEKPRRMLSTLMNHEFLYRTMGGIESQTLYDELEDALRDEPHFWLQRGCLELEIDNLIRADNFISQAKALSPRDFSILTGFAHLQFCKALFNVANPKAPEFIEEACKTLDGVMAAHGTKSPHAFHVYCSQGISWSKRGLKTFDAKRDFLDILRVIAALGVKSHPQSKELAQLKRDVDGEYLNLALAR